MSARSQRPKIADAPQRHHVHIEDWRSLIDAEPATLIADATEGAEMLYSSGTTGKPKGVRAVCPALRSAPYPNSSVADVVLHQIDARAPLPVHGPALSFRTATLQRHDDAQWCNLVIMPRFDAARSLALIE